MNNFAVQIIDDVLVFNLLNSSKKLKLKFLKKLGLPESKKIESSKDLLHQYACFLQTKHLKDVTQDTIIPKCSNFNSVIVENRVLPHTESIIRNTIHKLDDYWSHTLVCEKKSYEKMLNFCKNINKNINVITVEIDHISKDLYSKLLLSKDFWNLFQSEHLLIYQEDSIIFKKGIEDFLEYDYIGAPWLPGQAGNLKVGNGGFSLRKKSAMLKCLEDKNPQADSIPEDVFFSQTLINSNWGNIANLEIAKNFSQERVPTKNPLGGHQYWLAKMPFKLLIK